MNEWNSDVGKLMGLIEKSCHLIAKVSRSRFAFAFGGTFADGDCRNMLFMLPSLLRA